MAAYGMILCGASKSIFADALTQQICEGRILHFENATQFTRWLFNQPRGSNVLAPLLVAGFREAKPCMDAIIAMRTGDISKLRIDKKRPQLSEAFPGVEISAAFADMAVMVQTTDQYLRTFKWVRKGQVDPNVRTRIGVGAEQLTDMVAAALLGEKVESEEDTVSTLDAISTLSSKRGGKKRKPTRGKKRKQEKMETTSCDNLKEPSAAKDQLSGKLWADMNDDEDWSDLIQAFSSLLLDAEEEKDAEEEEKHSPSNFQGPSAAKEKPLKLAPESRLATRSEHVCGFFMLA